MWDILCAAASASPRGKTTIHASKEVRIL